VSNGSNLCARGKGQGTPREGSGNSGVNTLVLKDSFYYPIFRARFDVRVKILNELGFFLLNRDYPPRAP